MLVVLLALFFVGAMPASSRSLQAAGGEHARVRSAALTLVVRSQLPAWIAPGGRFTVSGYAGSRVPVVLRAGGRRIARVRSGTLGRFDVRLRAPRTGRYTLTVRVGSLVKRVGILTVRPLELAAVGDVTPGEQVGPTVLSSGAAYPWSGVARVLRNADIATANLEGAVSSRGAPVPGKQYHFQGPRKLLTGARTFGGIDVLTLANNHVMDYGAVGLYDTLAAARRAGISTVGAGATIEAARRPVFVRAGGLTVAFLGYSDVNPAGFVASEASPGTAAADSAAIAADVRAARRKADLVVCWFHWGTELHPNPDSRQRQFAAAALDAGAKLVLGAHPHVFGPVDRPTRTTLVAWTLGNFVFPSASSATSRTAILLVGLTSRGVSGFHLVPAVSGVRPVLAGPQ